MGFNLEVPHGHLFVRSIGEKGIRVGDDFYTSPLILSADQLLSDWNVESVDDFNEESLQDIFEIQPELVLIGTGKTQIFLPIQVQGLFIRRGIGLEVMTTDAACRTFNILVAEERHVVAAMLPPA
jgi:uncharacterized protein